MKCYCISGLGADKRAFKNLDFGYDLIHIEWVVPKPKESLSDYSKRISEQIDNSESFIILGLSFGGLIACEISNFLRPKQTILISSLTNKKDLSLFFRLIGRIHIHRFIPHFLMKLPMFLAYWFFGVESANNKKLLNDIISDTDTKLLKWSINKLLNHQPISLPANLLRIHGTNDRLISAKQALDIHWIKEGGHFIIIEEANQINFFLSRKIKKPSI